MMEKDLTGWQKQPNKLNIQGEIEKAISEITGEEIELKTYFFGHIVFQDLSYQAKFPLIFPKFFLENPKNGENLSTFEYSKKIVNRKSDNRK